jgi:hypothetical protein
LKNGCSAVDDAVLIATEQRAQSKRVLNVDVRNVANDVCSNDRDLTGRVTISRAAHATDSSKYALRS